MNRFLLVSLILLNTLNVRSQTDNIDFENGNTLGWTCGSGTYGEKGITDCKYDFPVLINYDGICQNQNGINGSNYPANPKENRHTITSLGTDLNSFYTIPCVAPAALFPNGINKFSFRIGNAPSTISTTIGNSDTLPDAEGIKYTFRVDTSNAQLTYLYSVFMLDASHFPTDAPRFVIKLRDQAGNTDASLSKTITPDQTALNFQDGVVPDSAYHERWRYTSWQKVSLDLTAYINQYVSIEFATTDCYPRDRLFQTINGKLDTICLEGRRGRHSAYAYIDLYTSSVITNINPIDPGNISIDIFPNPMNTELNIRMDGLTNITPCELKMFNYQGQEVKSEWLKSGSQKLERGNLANGIYFITISQRGQIMDKKKIIIKD